MLLRSQKKRNTKVMKPMNVAKNRRIAHQVLYHTGSITISSTVGVAFHLPSLLAAFTIKL